MKSFLKNSVERFLNYKQKVKGFSDTTLRTYRLNLLEAIEHLDVVVDKEKIILQLMPYRLYIANKDKKTIAKKISIIRSFVEFLKNDGKDIKLLNDESVKVPKTLPKPVEFRYIKEALKFVDEEEELIVLLLYGFGLRVSELSNLKIEDIKNDWIRVNGKGDKTRNIPILPFIKSKIDSYLEKNIKKV